MQSLTQTGAEPEPDRNGDGPSVLTAEMIEVRMIGLVVAFRGEQKPAAVTPSAADVQKEVFQEAKAALAAGQAGQEKVARDALLPNLMTAQIADGQSLLKKFRA
jgi:hypothetical protein